MKFRGFPLQSNSKFKSWRIKKIKRNFERIPKAIWFLWSELFKNSDIIIPSEIWKNFWSRCPRLMCLQRRNAHQFFFHFFSKIRYNWCILVVHPKTYVGFFSDVIRYPAWGSKWCTAVCFCKLFFANIVLSVSLFIFLVKVSNKRKK